MNNYVEQSDNSTFVIIDDWHVGLWITDEGNLEIFVEHDLGDITESDEDITEADNQWAKKLLAPISRLRRNRLSSRIRNMDGSYRNVRVEVRH